MTSKWMIKQALIAGLYAAITVVFSFMSYMGVQFRISEALLVLALFNPRHSVGILLGTFLSNLFSPIGVIDWVVGTSASALALWGMIRYKDKPLIWILIPSLANGLLVGLELYFVFGLPFFLSFLQVAFGEAVVMALAAYPLTLLIKRNARVLHYIKED